MQKSVTRNIKDETLQHVPYIYNNLPTKPVKSTETALHHVITHIQEAVETRSYTWTCLCIVGASDSTARDITKAPNGTGLETHSNDKLAPCRVAEKVEPHSEEIFWRGLWPSSNRRGAFYYPCFACRRSHRETQREWRLYTAYAVSSWVEKSQILSHSFFRRLWVWNNSGELQLRY